MIDVARKGVSAVKWSTSSTLARIALQMVAQVFLARRLGPHVYGVFGIGLVIFTFSNFLATFGFGWALLQVADVTEDDIRFAFTWQLASGLLAGAALYELAPELSTFFHDSRLLPVVRWMSIACVLNAAASPAFSLLQRDLNFRATGLIDVAGYGLGYIGVGIPLAIAGFGVYALVAAWLTQASTKALACFLLRRHSVRPLVWYRRAPVMFAVGSTVFATNLVNWLLNNLDSLLIGRLLNTQAVGLYNVGYNLATTPNNLLVGALQPAFFSASARMQGDAKRMGRAFLQVVATIWVLVLPLFVFLSVVAGNIVGLLYGPAWAPSGGVLALLFLAIPFYVTWGVSTPILWSTGRKHYESLLQVPVLLIALVAFYHYAPRGIMPAAMVALALLVGRGLIVGAAACRAVDLHLGDLVPHVARGMLLSVGVAVGATLGLRGAAPFEKQWLSLGAAGCLAAAFAAGIFGVWPCVLGPHAATMVVRFFPRLGGVIGLPVATPPTPQTS